MSGWSATEKDRAGTTSRKATRTCWIGSPAYLGPITLTRRCVRPLLARHSSSPRSSRSNSQCGLCHNQTRQLRRSRMFIAKAIANQSKLRRSETKDAIYLALLRSCPRKQTGIYKINISSLRDSFVQETCSKNRKSDLSYTESPYRL